MITFQQLNGINFCQYMYKFKTSGHKFRPQIWVQTTKFHNDIFRFAKEVNIQQLYGMNWSHYIYKVETS